MGTHLRLRTERLGPEAEGRESSRMPGRIPGPQWRPGTDAGPLPFLHAPASSDPEGDHAGSNSRDQRARPPSPRRATPGFPRSASPGAWAGPLAPRCSQKPTRCPELSGSPRGQWWPAVTPVRCATQRAAFPEDVGEEWS